MCPLSTEGGRGGGVGGSAHSDRFVRGRAGQVLAVWRVREGVHALRVPLQCPQHLLLKRVPDKDGPAPQAPSLVAALTSVTAGLTVAFLREPHLSQAALATRLPSGANTASNTLPECPGQGQFGFTTLVFRSPAGPPSHFAAMP